jgi:hypothetical protein
MKLFKLLYRIEDDVNYNCLDKCPFGKAPMCGSYACQKCKHCIGCGKMPVWDLSKNKGVNFNQGYIICSHVYKTKTFKMRVMRVIHLIKLKLRKL